MIEHTTQTQQNCCLVARFVENFTLTLATLSLSACGNNQFEWCLAVIDSGFLLSSLKDKCTKIERDEITLINEELTRFHDAPGGRIVSKFPRTLASSRGNSIHYCSFQELLHPRGHKTSRAEGEP